MIEPNKEVPIIVSLVGSVENDFEFMIKQFENCKVAAYELNLSCPHVDKVGLDVGDDPELVKKIVRAVKAATNVPVFVKIGLGNTDYLETVSVAIEAGVDGITAINTLRAMAIDVVKKLRDFALQLSSSKISEVSKSPDLHIIQSISSLDEIDRIINGISSLIREWYGRHFPELDNIIDSIIGYSQIVLAGKREDLTKKVFEDAGFPESKVEMLLLVSKKSRGGDISPENLSIVQSLATLLEFSTPKIMPFGPIISDM